jgi:hypothetical protein
MVFQLSGGRGEIKFQQLQRLVTRWLQWIFEVTVEATKLLTVMTQ